MKFLQTNNTLDGKPRVLEIGVDFDEIHHYNAEENRAENTELNLRNGINVTCLEYCYLSKPLTEIGGIAHFDVIEYESPDEYKQVFDIAHYSVDSNIFEDMGQSIVEIINHGSIFLPENQAKFPDLYKKTLKIIS